MGHSGAWRARGWRLDTWPATPAGRWPAPDAPRLRRHRCTPPHVFTGCDLLVTRLAPRPVTGALCVSLAGLGVEEAPAGLHTPGGRWPRASARAPWPRVHRRGIGLGQGRLDCAPGSRHPGAPRPLRRGQLRPGGLRREGTRGPQRGQAVRRWPRRPREPHRLANVWGSAAVATAWVQPEGETRVGLDPQLPHDLMHVRPMLPALPAGAGHDLCCRRLVAGVAPLDRHARRVELETAGGQTEALGSGGRQAAVECGDPMGLRGSKARPQASAVRC